MNDPGRETREIERTYFVRLVITSFVVGFCLYAGMKMYQVTVALQVFEGQQVPVSDNPKLKPAR